MNQQYYAVVFSAGYFGTLFIGDIKQVKKITRNCSNMNPVLSMEDGGRALVLSLHREYYILIP